MHYDLCFKDKHGLHLKDANHKDKQNFQAVVNITHYGICYQMYHNQMVQINCHGNLIKCVIDSYLDKVLAPLKRIEKLYGMLFLY